MIAVNPICKFGISTRPLHTTVEHMLGVGAEQDSDSVSDGARRPTDRRPSSSTYGSTSAEENGASCSWRSYLSDRPPAIKRMVRITARIIVSAVIVAFAVLVPQFLMIMSFVGSFSTVVICIVGPACAYLNIFKEKVPRWERYGGWGLAVIGLTFAVVGTVWSFLPLDEIDPIDRTR